MRFDDDDGLQDERTTLAWERTAIATMAAGLLIARYATLSLHWSFGVAGLAAVVLGSVILVWAGQRYDEMQLHIERGANPVHPTATRLVGLLGVAVTGVATILAIVIAIRT
jgi:uncharacterized membrane protein YidH (DUF202 family)